MKLQYSKDASGNDILEDETGIHQVMMAWEKPYMEACVDRLDVSGSVLEIGFGLGYSARRLCSQPNITEYSVIECCPTVWKKVEEFRKEFPNLNINLIKGRWQDVLCIAGKYDTCFFDDYLPDGTSNRFSKFLSEFLPYHARIGCQIGVFSTNYVSHEVYTRSYMKSECERYSIDIPKNCKYASGNKTYVVKLTKVGELTDDDVAELKRLTKPEPVAGGLSQNVTFEAVKGTAAQVGHASEYQEIHDLYFAGTDMGKVARISEEYLEKFTINNTRRRMVMFFRGFALFHTDRIESKRVFSELLETEDLEEDIRGWSADNISRLG